jgi:predicted nucleic acid-binding protein
MILIDTSVWVDFLAGRSGAAGLQSLLLANEVVCHPAVRGELALGSIANRERVLGLLASLPHVAVVDDDGVMRLIEKARLDSTGIGWVDAHLLASAEREAALLWTHDRRLERAARQLGVAR